MCAQRFDKKCSAILWFASGFVRDLRIVLPNVPTIFPNALEFAETCRNPWKSTAIQGQWCFTRRRTFRNSVKVRCTQRDKRGARYTALISAAAAHLIALFFTYTVPHFPTIIVSLLNKEQCFSFLILHLLSTSTPSPYPSLHDFNLLCRSDLMMESRERNR